MNKEEKKKLEIYTFLYDQNVDILKFIIDFINEYTNAYEKYIKTPNTHEPFDKFAYKNMSKSIEIQRDIQKYNFVIKNSTDFKRNFISSIKKYVSTITKIEFDYKTQFYKDTLYAFNTIIINLPAFTNKSDLAV